MPELCALGGEECACDEQHGGKEYGEPEIAHVEEPAERQAGHEDKGILGVMSDK